MLRVCICCGGGFSNSVLMRKVKSELVEKGYDDKLKIGFCPFKEVHEHYGEYDVWNDECKRSVSGCFGYL